MFIKTNAFITTNTELQDLTKEAIENYLFDKDTDPDGMIEAGLAIIKSAPWDDGEVSDIFQVENFPTVYDKWDALDNVAKRQVQE